ncbi:MAG: hypothetical protein DWQ07_23840 [Chloroflexi bacterium]|nr:MAG: hypothetical protein DWQ07_23840 [Chloroflexota bacterium]MBL1194180.1 hypothetical protein [Chloroflexota bacterium]NOH11472.1 hypothetical protein [Chloroflexota bacterium]
MAPEVTVPFLEEWQASPHADASAEAFVHWDEDDPAVIPVFCAKCHAASGYKDFLGADGSEFGVVDAEVPVGEVITCDTCHNEAAASMDSVVMPSGVEISGLGAEARCMQCHQGRASSVAVDETIAELGIEGEDEVNEELGFINIHYYAATATKYGTLTKGGYEYAGNTYDARFDHVEGSQTCIDCHDSHTLEVKVADCASCHTGVESVEDLRDVRMAGSLVDYDGDGDMQEGIAFEIAGLQELLYQAIQAYAAEVPGTPVVYDSHAYPYFFIDDGNGEVDDGEAIFPNKYASWTPRLLKAAYNYQVSLKDPGGYAHGGKYIIQLLYDSIEDLNTGIDISTANRIDHGHFAGSEEAFRHWDEDGAVPGSCSRCHSTEGLGLFLTEGVEISQEPGNGFTCATCHTDLDTYALYEVTEVTFPSGATVESESSLCMTCHQGRSSTNSVNGAVEGLPADTPTDQIRFINIHYFAAGATRFGDVAKGAFQYDGKNYTGLFEHVERATECSDCHNAHALEVDATLCTACHTEVTTAADFKNIRFETTLDYDGDGDTEEGVAGEIDGLAEILYAAIQEYAAEAGTPIIYDSHAYPYFFIDTDGDGESAGPSEANYGNQYNVWTPRLLQAAYNYQYSQKDPGAYVHNAEYVAQVLFDSIQDIGGSTAGLVRP